MNDEISLKDRLLGIGTEVGTGIGTDVATSGLLAGGPFGWLAYAGINFGSGAYTNYLVQKHLYGQDNVNWGEILASGAMGMIPFMDVKVGKLAGLVGKTGTVQRGIVGGALTGLGGEQLRVGIDEQRFLNPLEAAISVGVGGGLGGGLTRLTQRRNLIPEFDPTGNQIKTDAVTQVSQKLGIDPEIALQQQGLKLRMMKHNDGLGSEQPFNTSRNEPIYAALEGSDELTPNFLNQWQKRAKTGEQTYYFDITGHRILDVPGMDNIINRTRYKQWLTQNQINRYQYASVYPEETLRNFPNTDFYDSQGQPWRLVKANQDDVGPGQEYIPMPVSEIDSRKLKAKTSSESDRILLRELKKLNVKERNALEKQYPWLIDWNSDISGQNYHEHMIGLDETEFWNSAFGKSLGYMNNDVYILDKGLGNIVFLNDPKFKIMKDQIADYITPSSKTEIYPGLRKRTKQVKKFKKGKYKGLNAVIGYEADINSPNKSDLLLYAYDPSSSKNIGFKTEYTIPNYYSALYARKKDGTNLFPLEIREGIVRELVESYLNDNPQRLIHLEDLTEHIYKMYGVNIDLQNPRALEQWDPDFGVISSDTKVDTSADEKIFKTTPKNERKRKKELLRLLDLLKNGRYKQLTLELLLPDDK